MENKTEKTEIDIQEFKDIIKNYTEWLNKEISLVKSGNFDDSYIIQIPFLDRHNDWIRIMITKLNDGSYMLSDNGYTFADLTDCGEITSKNVYAFLKALVKFGVTMNPNDELIMKATESSFPQKLNSMIQIILIMSNSIR